MYILNEDAAYRRHGRTWAARVKCPLNTDIGLLHGWDNSTVPLEAFGPPTIACRGMHLSWTEKVSRTFVDDGNHAPREARCKNCDTLFCLPPRTPPNTPLPGGNADLDDSRDTLKALYREACRILGRLELWDSMELFRLLTLARTVRETLENESIRHEEARKNINRACSEVITAANLRLQNPTSRTASIQASIDTSIKASKDAIASATDTLQSEGSLNSTTPSITAEDMEDHTQDPWVPVDGSLFKTKTADFDTYLMCQTGVSHELEQIGSRQYAMSGGDRAQPTEEKYVATISMIRRLGFRFETGDGTTLDDDASIDGLHPIVGPRPDVRSFLLRLWCFDNYPDRYRPDPPPVRGDALPLCPGPGCMSAEMSSRYPESHACRYSPYYNSDYDEIHIYKDAIRRRLVAAYRSAGVPIDPADVATSYFWSDRSREARAEIAGMWLSDISRCTLRPISRATLYRNPAAYRRPVFNRRPTLVFAAFPDPTPEIVPLLQARRSSRAAPSAEAHPPRSTASRRRPRTASTPYPDPTSEAAPSSKANPISRARPPTTPQATPRAATPATPPVPLVRNAAAQPAVKTAPAVAPPIQPTIATTSTLPDDLGDPGSLLPTTTPSTTPGQPPVPAVSRPASEPVPPDAQGAEHTGPTRQTVVDIPESLQAQINDFVLGPRTTFVRTSTGFMTVPPVSSRPDASSSAGQTGLSWAREARKTQQKKAKKKKKRLKKAERVAVAAAAAAAAAEPDPAPPSPLLHTTTSPHCFIFSVVNN